MTSGAFNTETEQMTKAATQVRDVNSTITSELSSLESAVEGVQAYWTGEGATSFQQLMTKWNEDSKKLNSALETIAEQIQTSSGTYSQQDQQSEQALSKIVSSLNM